MTITELKTTIDELDLTDGIRSKIDEIMKAAVSRGDATKEELDTVAQLLEIEEELKDIELTATEDVIKALEEYESESLAVFEGAVAQLEAAAA